MLHSRDIKMSNFETENKTANNKKVLYLTNIEVPYRVRAFNELAKHCDLTVVYERKKSTNRDGKWAGSEKPNYNIKYLEGIKVGNEGSFSLKLLKEIFSGYDEIIVGCYNSPVQMAAIILMRLFRKPYILNVDGEVFLGDKGIKSKLKKFFLSGASKYLAAGEKSADSLRIFVKEKEVIPYYFSSLYESELFENKAVAAKAGRKDTVLVVGQYFDYKGMDIALEVARRDKAHKYKFVGTGIRTEDFIKDNNICDENIEVIPFLQKSELEEEYRSCRMLLLPSRQECWGLVVNEAASFGTPIISTWGSGAAVEFLSDEYPQYLAEPENPDSLLCSIEKLRESDSISYSEYLIKKSESYSIEASVKAHVKACQLF